MPALHIFWSSLDNKSIVMWSKIKEEPCNAKEELFVCKFSWSENLVMQQSITVLND